MASLHVTHLLSRALTPLPFLHSPHSTPDDDGHTQDDEKALSKARTSQKDTKTLVENTMHCAEF